MSLRPERLRRFAQRSRDVVLASAVVGVVTGLVVAGCEWLAQQMLDGIATLPDWLVVAAPGVGESRRLATGQETNTGPSTPSGSSARWRSGSSSVSEPERSRGSSTRRTT